MTNTQKGDAQTDQEAIRCYAYARTAKSNPLAMERQVEVCRALAETLSSPGAEYRVVRVFEDDGRSGWSGPRAGYEEMLTGLERGEAAVVLVSAEDRLYRNIDLQKAYSELSDRLSVTTYSAQSGQLGR